MSTTNSAEEEEQKCVPLHDPTDPLQQELTQILKSFKIDIMGFVHIGRDGVVRSSTSNNRVLSAQGLSTFHPP
jgi:hypothetical protein